MATYYVGPGGSDSNDGLSWANRKATLNGAEDIPVAAGDTVYVGPGVYPETLTADVNGSSGNQITYFADYAGQYTDGIGGTILIQGVNNGINSLGGSRGTSIDNNSRTFRTYMGFMMGGNTTDCVANLAGSCVLDRCVMQTESGGDDCVTVANGSTQVRITRNMMIGAQGLVVSSGSTGAASYIENCIVMSSANDNVRLLADGWIMRHVTTLGSTGDGLDASTAGSLNEAYNNIFQGNNLCSFRGPGVGSGLTENFNALNASFGTMRVNTPTGAQSVPALFVFDRNFVPLGTGVGSGMWDRPCQPSMVPTGDFYGNPRLQAAPSAISNWGAVQHPGVWTRSSTAATGSYSAQVTGVGFKYFQVPRTGSAYVVNAYVRVSSGTGTPRPYIELLDGYENVVATATATAASESGFELLQVTMPAAAAITHRLRFCNPNAALTVLIDDVGPA